MSTDFRNKFSVARGCCDAGGEVPIGTSWRPWDQEAGLTFPKLNPTGTIGADPPVGDATFITRPQGDYTSGDFTCALLTGQNNNPPANTTYRWWTMHRFATGEAEASTATTLILRVPTYAISDPINNNPTTGFYYEVPSSSAVKIWTEAPNNNSVIDGNLAAVGLSVDIDITTLRDEFETDTGLPISATNIFSVVMKGMWNEPAFPPLVGVGRPYITNDSYYQILDFGQPSPQFIAINP